jgi:hypothetical protein
METVSYSGFEAAERLAQTAAYVLSETIHQIEAEPGFSLETITTPSGMRLPPAPTDGPTQSGPGSQSPLHFERLPAVSQKRAFERASVCFYGQKLEYMAAIRKTRLLDLNHSQMRLYNLAGIPMMVRLIAPILGAESSIDVVMELVGQQAHDFVPGAFLALRAGAIILEPSGKRIGYERLGELLLRPAASRQRYVMAMDEELAHKMAACVFPDEYHAAP